MIQCLFQKLQLLILKMIATNCPTPLKWIRVPSRSRIDLNKTTWKQQHASGRRYYQSLYRYLLSEIETFEQKYGRSGLLKRIWDTFSQTLAWMAASFAEIAVKAKTIQPLLLSFTTLQKWNKDPIKEHNCCQEFSTI